MTDHRVVLDLARGAYAGCDWPTAVTHFDALPVEELSADDLAAYGDAAWWLGRIEDTLRLGAAACDAYQAAGRAAEAAATAVLLAIFHLSRGDEPTGMGWFGRAGRLLEGTPEGPVHGLMICWTEVEPALMTGQHAAAIDAARRVLDIGHRCDDPDLLALGTLSEGRALIMSGHVADGLALIDEAMVTVLDGRCTPGASGVMYCHTVATCHQIVDIRRQTHWTDLTERWLTTFPAAVAFEGLCAVHRAQLQLLRGRWDDVERDALRVAKGFERQRVDYAAEAWYLVGESRRLRGDSSAAEAYDAAHARGRDPQPGRALLRLDQGDTNGAATSIRSAVAAVGDDPLLRAPLCAAADAGAPILVTVLLSWFIAALLHFAIGSVSVGAITAAGIIAPVVASTGVDPVVIALAIASGAMFALHVNSNFFWMFKSLLGLSTQGALKTLTLATSLGAIVSLPMVLVASIFA